MKLTAVVAVVLGVVACGGDKKSGAQLATKDNMIPDNAVVAVKVMPEQLWEKALGDPDSQARQLLNMMKVGLSMSAGELGELGDDISSIMKDASSLGLDLTAPVVISLSGDLEKIETEEASVEMCMVALLSDKDAFVSLLDATLDFAEDNAGFEVKKSTDAGFAHYELYAEEGAYFDLAVTSESVIFRFSYDTLSESKNLKKSMSELFADGGKKAGVEEFYASKADLAVWGDFAGLMNTVMPALEMADAAEVQMLKEYLPMYEDASMMVTLNFEDGATVLEMMMKGSEAMIATAQKYNAAASDTYFKYLPATSVFVANFAIKDFPGLIDEICQSNPEYKETFEYLKESMGIDEEFLAGFPGLITIALDGYGIDRKEVPGFVAFMECSETVWDFAAGFLGEVAEQVGTNQYNVNDMFYVAYEEPAIIIVEKETLARSFDGTASSFANVPLASEISKGGFVINVDAIPGYLLDSLADELEMDFTGDDLLEYLSSVVVTSSDDHMSAKVILNMNDKEHNLLEKVVELFVDQVAGQLAF